MTSFSRYCRNFYRYPHPNHEPDRYFEMINRLIETLDIDLLIPAYDEAIFLSKFRNKLIKPQVIAAIPAYEKLMILHHKPSLYALCKELGCDIINHMLLESIEDLEKVANTFAFPIVLKPERGGGGWAVQFVQNRKELYRFWNAFDQKRHGNRLFAQEYIGGDLYGHGVICLQGKVLAANTYRICRQHPPGCGTSTFRKTVELADIRRQVAIILANLSWTGVCQMDFMRREQDDRMFIMDANPRFWGSTAHGLACGVNFPFLLYLLASDQNNEILIPPVCQGEPTSTWLWGDMVVMLQRLLKSPLRIQVIKEHLHSWSDTYFDDFLREDPLPFFSYPIQKVAAAILRFRGEGF